MIVPAYASLRKLSFVKLTSFQYLASTWLQAAWVRDISELLTSVSLFWCHQSGSYFNKSALRRH